jgi:hypothetical protein
MFLFPTVKKIPQGKIIDHYIFIPPCGNLTPLGHFNYGRFNYGHFNYGNLKYARPPKGEIAQGLF